MRKRLVGRRIAFGAVLAFTMAGCGGEVPAPLEAGAMTAAQSGSSGGASPSGEAQAGTSSLDEMFVHWPLLPANQVYGSIDGRRLHKYVVEQATISRKHRDQGNQFWGRIIGTSSDVESAEWLLAKFKQIGLTDTRIQPLELQPQWMPRSWDVTATGGGNTLRLASAWPASPSVGTSGEGLDLEAAYVGLGSEAEFMGRDVRGKAVFIYTPPKPGVGERGASERAQARGAAAIFEINGSPGNIKTLLGLTSSGQPTRLINVPMFGLGRDDGFAVRDLIAQAPAGKGPRVKVRMDVQIVPNLKTATVWGTLPGATDETIYVMAHRDGYFDAASDNASGIASILGVAEHFAKIPQAERRRTLIFLGMSGHHPPPQNPSVDWFMANRDQVFAKTALVICAEHTSTLQTYLRGDTIRRANTYTAQLWYAGGPTRPKLQEIAVQAFKDFGVPIYTEQDAPGPAGSDLSMKNFWRYVPAVQSADYNIYFHTDEETPETVPWTGLEATTRAYARIIDGVNTLELKDLQRPPELPPSTGSRP